MKHRFLLDLTLHSEGEGTPAEGQEGASQAAETKAADGSGNAGNAALEGQPATDKSENDPEAEFEGLISGKYKEQYDRRVRSTIKKRVGEDKAVRETASKAQRLVSALSARYGLKDATIDDVLQAIDGDDNLYEDAAAKAGLSPEQFRALNSIQAERDSYKNELEQAKRHQLEEEFREKLEWEAASCKSLFPGFDFEREIQQNETFANCIRGGMDVTAAYKYAHMDEIISGGIKMGVEKGAAKTAEAVRSNVQRPVESASGTGAAVSVSRDYASMSDEEFAKLREAVKNGY